MPMVREGINQKECVLKCDNDIDGEQDHVTVVDLNSDTCTRARKEVVHMLGEPRGTPEI